MRALVVTNMYPSARRPALGVFVRDQVRELRRLGGLDVELYAFPPGGRSYVRAARDLRRRFAASRFDVVHAHFGLSAWPALAVPADRRLVTLHGTDLAHPRSGPVSRAALPLLDLAATVSASLASRLPGAGVRRRVAVLPCGVDLERFAPRDRRQAREQLGLDPSGPYLLFPSDPRRAVKRHDRARALAGEVPLLALEDVTPDEVPLWVNAANAVLVPSDSEGFGLAALEALACRVPVLATPVGIAPLALSGLAGTLCAPFELTAWRSALAPHLAASDPRLDGSARERAELFSARRMAQRVAVAWRELVGPAEGTGRPRAARRNPRRRYTRAPHPPGGPTKP